MTKKVAIAFNKKLDNLFLIKEDIPETEQMGLHQVQQKGKYSLTPNFEKWKEIIKCRLGNFLLGFIVLYSETLNNEYIGRIYQRSSWQFFNEFYTILRKFQYLRK